MRATHDSRPTDPAGPETAGPETGHVRLARWLSEHPANHDGADKTWVFRTVRRLQRFFRDAVPLSGAGPDGSVR